MSALLKAPGVFDAAPLFSSAPRSSPPLRRRASTDDQQTTAASSNAAASGRSFVLLVDIIALSPEQLAEVRDAAPQFINRVGGDQRRTAVVTVGDRLRIITDFAAGDEFRSALARATTSAFTQTAAGLTAADAQASHVSAA